MITKKMLFPCLALILFGWGCSKEKTYSEPDRQAAERASQEYMEVEAIFENMFKLVDKQAKQQGDLNGFVDREPEIETRGGDCPVVDLITTENTIFPARLTLDFGDGCIDDDGISASGKIIAVFNGLLFSKGTSISLSYEDFTYAGHGISGTYEIANQGKDENDQPTFTSVVDGTLINLEGKSLTYQASTISKQTVGNDTNFFTDGFAGIFDDVWSTSREASLTTSDGLEVNITTPNLIQNPLNCLWPVSGTFSLDINDPEVTGTLDFGDGNCDDNALLTIGDYVVEIDL